MEGKSYLVVLDLAKCCTAKRKNKAFGKGENKTAS